MSQLDLVIILGTRRKNNRSQYVARHAQRVAQATGDWEVSLVDPSNLDIQIDDESDPKYEAMCAKADAFLIVSPEYNHGYSGTLKLVLDSQWDNYKHKPVAVAGVSSGRYAGARGIVTLAEVLRRLGLIQTQDDILVGDAKNAYDEHGEPTEAYIEESMLAVLEELKWLAKTLKNGRDNNNHQTAA